MRIAVGSTNPAKRRAVEAAVTGRGIPAEVAVETIAVDSGVPEQPRGHGETVTGAENRATGALAAGAYELGVGLEGGVARFEGATGLYLIMWSAVTDGAQWGRSAGPSYRLPNRIARRVENGAELGPVMADVLDQTDVAQRQGAAGALTAGRVDREDALAAAVAGALGPFVSDLYE